MVSNARRPLVRIRPAPISPPRSALAVTTDDSAVVAMHTVASPNAGLNRRGGWMLPPPRTPAMRTPKRPVLLIVDEEDAPAAELTPKPAGIAALRKRSVIFAFAGALALGAAALGLVVGSASSARSARPVITGATSKATAVAVATSAP